MVFQNPICFVTLRCKIILCFYRSYLNCRCSHLASKYKGTMNVDSLSKVALTAALAIGCELYWRPADLNCPAVLGKIDTSPAGPCPDIDIFPIAKEVRKVAVKLDEVALDTKSVFIAFFAGLCCGGGGVLAAVRLVNAKHGFGARGRRRGGGRLEPTPH